MYSENEKVVPIAIENEMRNSYIDYAMSVIVGRALPDVRDGLKPVHRRILHAMNELGLAHNKPYRKSARIVGEVLGKYHPHGDTAVYDTLVRMVQDFSLRYPLVDGQGNFGSVDGDNAAAMRYTEARLHSISTELLGDIDKDTVQFVPNFDESLDEPALLPARIPNLLINGSAGIAVGMATNIPPHNLSEITDAVIAVIDNPEVTIKDLQKIVKGPDFPTAGLICGRDGIRSAYETGRGRIIMRAKAIIEVGKGKKDQIVITEIPYQVNKATMITAIAKLAENKKVEGIYDIRDESDRDGMRVVVELKRDQNAQVILNQLYKHTQMQETFGVIMLALVDGQPRVLTLKEMLTAFIEHRVEVVRRRTQFELDRAEKRAHILEGLKKCFAHLDAIIKTIRQAKTIELAKAALMKNFKLTDLQAKAILEMQLQRLAHLERQKIEDEYLELIKKIEYYKAVLASKKKVLGIVKEEAEEVKKKYGDERRTVIVAAEEDIEIEDMIKEEDVLVTLSHEGYIKRIPVSVYRAQRRGGKGVTGAAMKDEDFIEHLFLASTHDYILFFTTKGRVYWRRAYEIPQASRQAKGRAIVNVLSLAQGEAVSAMIQVREFDDKRNIVMVTQKGVIKKTNLQHFSRPRASGIIAIKLQDKDELIGCKLTSGNDEIFLATKAGQAIRFNEKQVREMGRSAGGVRGIRLGKKNDEVIALELTQKNTTLLTVTSQGYAKRTKFEEYRLQGRGGSGIINSKVTEKNGHVVNVLSVSNDDQAIFVTTGGMVVRVPVAQIRASGRNTQGVRVVRLKDKHRIASAARVVAKEEIAEE